MRGLLLGRPQPHKIGVFDDGVEDHQTLNSMAQRQRSPQAAVRLANRRVECTLIEMVDARPVVAAVVHRGVAEPYELGEELPRLFAVDDAAEASVLAGDAHTGVKHDGCQEPGLPLGEALLGDGLYAVIEGHRSNSSMMLGVRPPLRPPPSRAEK